jgi:two-component system OmpR family sensor kinase
MTGRVVHADPDAAALRRASRNVGLQIAVASSVLVLLVVAAAFAFVFAHLKPSHLLGRHDSTIDVGGRDILIAAIVIGVAAIALAGLLSWFATRRAIRPLGEALRLQRTFVANASHELRTPLAVLDARLQYLQRGLGIDDPATATVGELRRDAGTLVQIVNDLLVTAEEGGEVDASDASVEAEPVVRLAVESLRILAAERQIVITLDAHPVSVLMPAASIHRCVVALLDNALRFAPDGSTVGVSLTADRTTAELRVTDHGSGISGLEPARVFERFARGAGGDTSLAGFGIGLSLVRDTVARYAGSASVEATGPAGTTMLLRLPRARRR